MSSVSKVPHAKFLLSYDTVSRIERIADTKVTRGMDKILNIALDNLEGKQN